MKLHIDKERCKSCEYCVYYCPKKVLSIDKKEFTKTGYNPVQLIESEVKKCNLCGTCYTVCPDYVFEIK
jgi:2-oxoglutarate ferredoxin oxidoreductase subunit delta